MKKIVVMLILIGMTVAAGFRQYDIKSLYYDGYINTDCTVPQDSIQQHSNGYYQIHTVATQPDTMRSKSIFKNTAQCTQTIYAGIKSVSGTPKVYVEYGVYRGLEAGWYYYVLDSLMTDGQVATININDQDWGRNVIVDVWSLRLRESGNQRNHLWARVIEFYE